MEKVEFKCENCGERRRKSILPWKHSVLGTVSMLNRESGCCQNPDYRDDEGFRQSMVERNFREIIPGIA